MWWFKKREYGTPLYCYLEKAEEGYLQYISDTMPFLRHSDRLQPRCLSNFFNQLNIIQFTYSNGKYVFLSTALSQSKTQL